MNYVMIFNKMRLFLAIILLFSFNFLSFAQELIEEEKLDSLKEELEINKEKLEKTKKEEEKALGHLAEINKELKFTKYSLNSAQSKIKINLKKVDGLVVEIGQKRGTLAEKEVKYIKRIREVYKSGGLNYLELIFSSNSISDFLNRMYFFGKVIEYDSCLVREIRSDLSQIKRKKYLLEYKTREIQELASEIEKKKEEISRQAEEKKDLCDSLQRRRKEYEEKIAELEQSSKDLEVMILKKLAASTNGKVLGSGRFEWPLVGRITSRFGYRRHPVWGGRHFHTGLDIGDKHGSPVKVADSGEVIFAGWWDGYGKAIVIDHGRKTTTVYAHLSRIYKNVGAVVAKGQIIGLVGSTGYSTGPHLHFEIRENGKPIDPAKYLQ